jgi:hypothetical protein
MVAVPLAKGDTLLRRMLEIAIADYRNTPAILARMPASDRW